MKKLIGWSFLPVFGAAFWAGLLLASDPGRHDSVSSPAVTSDDSAVAKGQARTLLPDGRWLLTGGEGEAGPSATIQIRDSLTRTTLELPIELKSARAWHTATMLPDGTILILGGVGADGRVVDVAELLDLDKRTVEPLSFPKLAPRAHHTATLLTEGRVLIAGGMSDKGKMPETVELWDPRSRAGVSLANVLRTSRQDHTAILLATGKVAVWGGKDSFGSEPGYGELYDPQTQSWSIEGLRPKPFDDGIPFVEASIPDDGAAGVRIDTPIALRFSRPLAIELINPETLSLDGPQGKVAAKVVPAEGGMLAFINPSSPLLPGAIYTVSLGDRNDAAKPGLPLKTFTFETARESPDDDDWIPGDQAMRGDWSSHRPTSPWQSLPPLQAEPGVTALAGQALTLDGKPLARVTIQVEEERVLTDQTGRFLLRLEGMAGHCEMMIDGRTASKPNRTYGIFEAGLYVTEGRTNVLPYTIWMPKIDIDHSVKIPSPTTTEVTVTTPLIPGLEVHIPPHTVIRDHDGKAATQISITAIPVDRPPFPLPSGAYVPIYFTIQPGGAYVETSGGYGQGGVRLIYPNYRHELPGTRANFWHYDPEERGWYVYGRGTIASDGWQVVPDPGVVDLRVHWSDD